MIDCGSCESWASSPGLTQEKPGFKHLLGRFRFQVPQLSLVKPCYPPCLLDVPPWAATLGTGDCDKTGSKTKAICSTAFLVLSFMNRCSVVAAAISDSQGDFRC